MCVLVQVKSRVVMGLLEHPVEPFWCCESMKNHFLNRRPLDGPAHLPALSHSQRINIGAVPVYKYFIQRGYNWYIFPLVNITSKFSYDSEVCCVFLVFMEPLQPV